MFQPTEVVIPSCHESSPNVNPASFIQFDAPQIQPGLTEGEGTEEKGTENQSRKR